MAYLNNEVDFKTVRCNQLSDEELEMCRTFFGRNYGRWDPSSPKGGKQIKCPIKLYKLYQADPDAYVALAFIHNELIGQAFYLRKKLDGDRVVSFVLQLVVDEKYRRRGIAKTLLISIWGFSNDYAWGLATSNAVTVMTLEKTTHRKVTPSAIVHSWNSIQPIIDFVPFASREKIAINDNQSIIHSDFPVDQNIIQENLNLYNGEWKLGRLSLGDEWLAFTFKDQTPAFTPKEFDELFMNSGKIVEDAYSRMNHESQNWNKGHRREINTILSMLPDSAKIHTAIDWGCGTGRHCHTLAKRGISTIGIDYSSRNIQKAQEKMSDKEQFISGDCRTIKLPVQCDLALCLYDVIGSSVKVQENLAILRNIRRHLRRDGYLILSVMNLELTRKLAIHTVDTLRNNMKELHKLPSSNTMQDSGAIFNPDYYILERSTGIVYRKEQFENDGNLSAEYVIRDKRYSLKEIRRMLFLSGFRIISAAYVQAGQWDKPLSPTDTKAKEILVIAKRMI